MTKAMLGEFPESAVDMQIEPDRLSTVYRWSRRTLLTAVLALSVTILVLGVLALLLIGIPIALITGLVEGSWQASEQALTQLWRLSPALLAAEFVLAWLLIGIFIVLRKVLATFGVAET
ncbi:MAG: hypothetical protein OXK81_05970 [Chloroflexota bacterium]|nr:hypothetical protein [Chloroflexota bacterium]MDE2929958.1 hypothetical protein [Chloroflexota bacterium]